MEGSGPAKWLGATSVLVVQSVKDYEDMAARLLEGDRRSLRGLSDVLTNVEGEVGEKVGGLFQKSESARKFSRGMLATVESERCLRCSASVATLRKGKGRLAHLVVSDTLY